MISLLSLAIAPQCPWHGMYQQFGAANVHWCEELICGYINNPANTWSNLPYVLIAMYLILTRSKMKNQRQWMQNFHDYFAWSLLFTGLASGFYHATNNYFTQFLDFIGMFALDASLICVNFSRLSSTLKEAKFSELKFSKIIFWFITIVFSSSFFYAHYLFPVQFLVVICILAILVQEFIIYFKRKSHSYSRFWAAIAFLAMAQVSSQLDLQRIWCDPTDHFWQGHALWHVLGSIGITFYYLHIKQHEQSS